MATSGESFLLDLSSATATKTGAAREERYRLQLSPGINIPYLAEPRAQLEALTFANVFTNIDDGFYKNAKLKVTWNPYVYNGNQTVERHQKELEITIPQGHYDAVSLAHKIGELLYSDTTITEWPAITNYPLTGEKVSRKAATYITATSTLFSDMQVLATLPSKDLVKSVTIPENASDPKPNAEKYLDVTDEPSELTAYVGGWIRLNHVGQVFARIVGIEAILSDLDGGLSGDPAFISTQMSTKLLVALVPWPRLSTSSHRRSSLNQRVTRTLLLRPRQRMQTSLDTRHWVHAAQTSTRRAPGHSP